MNRPVKLPTWSKQIPLQDDRPPVSAHGPLNQPGGARERVQFVTVIKHIASPESSARSLTLLYALFLARHVPAHDKDPKEEQRPLWDGSQQRPSATLALAPPA